MINFFDIYGRKFKQLQKMDGLNSMETSHKDIIKEMIISQTPAGILQLGGRQENETKQSSTNVNSKCK